MKTAEQILDEVGPIAKVELYSDSYNKIIQAMKAYASQAVDECAEVAEAYTSYGEAYIKTNSILSVHSKLK